MILLLLLTILQEKPKPKELPVVKYSIPLAVPTAGKSKITFRGVRLDGVKSASTTTKEVTVKFVEAKKAGVPNNYPAEKLGDTEVSVELELPKNFSGDTLPITVKDANGESAVFNLIVAPKIINEVEPNDDFDKAQKLVGPITVDGVLQRERDIDLYQIDGKKGQELSVAIVSAKLGSPADAMLTLYDANKQVLKIVDDVDKSADPSCTIKLPADGIYYVCVTEANDLGTAQFGYRLVVK
jgi:Bacterial pre-peptidase C-terminal domain